MSNRAQAKLNFQKGVYGQNWKKLREKKGKTVREFEKDIYISYSKISKIENETDLPTIEQVNIYQKYFNVSLDYLVGLTDKPTLEVKDLCEYTGLSEKAVNTISSLAVPIYRKIGSHYECYRVIDALNYLIESDSFWLFITSLSMAYRRCKPNYISKEEFNNLFALNQNEDDQNNSDEASKLNNMSSEEETRFCSEMDEYCEKIGCEIISKDQIAEMKLYNAQTCLTNIFQNLIDETLRDDNPTDDTL